MTKDPNTSAETLKIHFVGIGGIGMSALAQLCHQLGHQVSGSNLGANKMLPILQQHGITGLFEIHAPENIPQGCNLVIYSEAINVENPERQHATTLQIEQISYFQGLGRFLQQHCVIAVTGTHGKTTTTGLMAQAFLEAGLDPTVIVGSTLSELEGSNFRLSGFLEKKRPHPWAIAEACEYRNNFRFLDPDIILLTNLELDHVDYYRSEAHYLETFQSFCHKARVVIHHADDDMAKKALINYSGLRIEVKPDKFENLKLSIPGAHNRENAGLVLACGEYLHETQADFSINNFLKGLSHFKGASRRQEVIFQDKNLIIYDDYGHHPTEVTATLNALREKHPNHTISLIFEPHQYSRTREFFDDFLNSFQHAHHIGLLPIYEARDTEDDKNSISIDSFVEVNKSIKPITSQTDALSFISQEPSPNVLVFMGAGKVSDFAHEFVSNIKS